MQPTNTCPTAGPVAGAAGSVRCGAPDPSRGGAPLLQKQACPTWPEAAVVVLDVDGDHGGFTSLRQLEQEHGSLPRTQRVRTGSGEHLYFVYPKVHLKNTAGKLGVGLDVRCCGGYAVTVGAVHRTGHVYT